MDSDFPYGDIIVIAAIAAFIILRYRAMLGEKSGRDASAVKPRPLQEFERVIQLPDREAAKLVQKAEPSEEGSFVDTYAAMRAIDKQFSSAEFVQGAKHAFEMVVEAFNDADLDTLKMLLSPGLYQHFAETLAMQKADGKKQHSTLIAITTAEVTDAQLSGVTAQLTVRFITEQVILWRNDVGAVVEGDPSHQQSVEDHWVFERKLSNADPAWKIVET